MATLTGRGRVLQVTMEGDTIRAAAGSMIAYEGNIEFKGSGMGGGQGFRAALKQKVAGESLKLMDISGQGVVYLAVDALNTSVLPLNNETMTIESDHLLAIPKAMNSDVKFHGLQGFVNGQGLATTVISGTGSVAITSDGPLIGLEVIPGAPVVVDPQAFVASRGNLTMNIVSAVSWRNLVGEGNGEAFSLRFEGHGLVMIQPAER